jgi:hypothetical protein
MRSAQRLRARGGVGSTQQPYIGHNNKTLGAEDVLDRHQGDTRGVARRATVGVRRRAHGEETRTAGPRRQR